MSAILIVEDDADAREVLQMSLEAHGHRVLVAADGAAGVALATSTRPALVLVDLSLPGLDGFEVARRIRAAVGHDVRLIALTGWEDRQRSAEAGFDDHLIKPVGADEILKMLT